MSIPDLAAAVDRLDGIVGEPGSLSEFLAGFLSVAEVVDAVANELALHDAGRS